MSVALVLLVAAALLAASAAYFLLRNGVRGPRASRWLGHMLHMGTRTPRLTKAWSVFHAILYSRSRGRVVARWFGNPVLVIETTGRRTGKRRATAITYVPVPRGWLVMPMNAGSDTTPAWWLNLKDSGQGRVIVDGHSYAVRPRVAEGQERQVLWSAYTAQAPVMRDYKSFTDRHVPVVVLEPKELFGSVRRNRHKTAAS